MRPVFWVGLLLVAGTLILLARQMPLRWTPALLLRLGLTALALLAAFWPRGDLRSEQLAAPQVMVVDQSDSLSDVSRLLARQEALAWQAAGENRMVVIYGVKPSAVTSGDLAWPQVDGRASRVAEALDLAADLFGPGSGSPPGAPGRVILLTDYGFARSFQGEGIEAMNQAVEKLAREGHTLDVRVLESRETTGDGWVGALMGPSLLWEGTPFSVLVPVIAPPEGGSPDLNLRVNGQPVPAAAEQAGDNLFRFSVPPQPQGITTLEVTAAYPGDPWPENNQAFSALHVAAAPRALLVTSAEGSAQATRLAELLAQGGIEVETISPGSFPTALEALERYRVVFIHNLLASDLSGERLQALDLFVTRMGGGAIFLGGRNAYTLGGYAGTRLESLLPVKLEPPPRAMRPPIVFQLVLDRSSSMTIQEDIGGPQPIDLAREAAMRAVENLRPEDWLGMLTFSDENSWAVDLRQLGGGLALRQALDAVARVDANGSTHMYAALEEALAAMAALPEGAPAARHLLVLSDGQSFDGSLPEFRALAEAARARGVTISSIALGSEADTETMQALAEAGQGRYYAVTQADELPRILIYESQAARSENIQTGQTGLKPGEPGHPVLSGIRFEDLPLLSGYNALSSRKTENAGQGTAEDILLSTSFGDPLLSAWQVGLGRVVAWMGDLGEGWAGSWSTPESEILFWSQVVRYALPSPSLGPVQVNVQVEEDKLVVEAGAFQENGDPLDMARVRFTYTDATGQARAFDLAQSAPGVYRAELQRPPEGAYRAVVQVTDGEVTRETAAPFSVDPPVEWRPLDPAAAAAGAQALAAWSEQTGGQVLEPGQAMDLSVQPAPAPASSSPWRPLLLALSLLWPLEIAIRRWKLPWM